MSGGKSDIVTSNAIKDFNRIKPISAVLAHTTAGHTGALDEPQGGSYTRLSFAWLDWQLKGDKANNKIFTNKRSNQFPEFTITSK